MLVRFLSLCTIFLATTVFAAGTVTIQGQGDDAGFTMIIEYLDNNNLRMNFPGRESSSGYMLIQNGKVYTVAMINGVPMVMDMGAMSKMASAFGGDQGGEKNQATGPLDYEVLEMKDTGRSETVAGFKGRVYQVKARGKNGIHTEEVVLSDAPEVRAYTEAWQNAGKTMEQALQQGKTSTNDLNDFMAKKGLGLLRYGKEFQVVSLDSKRPPAEHFKLPANQMKMPDFGSMFGGAMPQK